VGLIQGITFSGILPATVEDQLSTPAQYKSRSESNPLPRISDARRQIVEKARQAWIKKLIDVSRRNNLLYYRPLKTGTLDLSAAPAEEIRKLLAGENVAASKLLPDIEDEALNKSLRDISRRALENLEEKGLSTLFLTFGMATWPATDSGRAAEAPVLLLPVTLTKREGSNSYHLSSTGNFQLNLALLHVLQDEFKLTLQSDELLAQFSGDAEDGTVCDVKGICGEIQKRMKETKGFEIVFKTILGNFAFQKMAMVKDLRERASDLAAHSVIAAIAGDGEAKSEMNAKQVDPDPREFDTVLPENEFAVLDADSSQQNAIAAVLAGQSRVIHGPPGTGKSQTITNLIANLAATGQRVLFVAEKKAALDVVKRRLEEVGLGHLAIVLHGADLSPKKVMQQVAHTLQVVRTAVPVNCQQVHTQLVDRRNRLNAHVTRMHSLREPVRKSLYEMQGLVLQLGNSVKSSTRWRGDELLRMTPPVDRQITDLLTEAGGLASIFLRTDPSPWTGANLPTGDSVQTTLDLVEKIRFEALPRFLESVKGITDAGIRPPDSLAETSKLADLLEGVLITLSIYSPEIYGFDLESVLRSLRAGKDGGVSAVWAWCFNSNYRQARTSLLTLRTAGKASTTQLCKELIAAAAQLRVWSTWAVRQPYPVAFENIEKHVQNLRRLSDDVKTLNAVVPLQRVSQLSVPAFTQLLRSLGDDHSTPFQIPKLMQIEADLVTAGAAKLIDEVRSLKPDPKSWPAIFTHAWLSSALDHISQKDPEIRGFIGSTHNRYVGDFTRLDEERINLASDRVRRAHGERAIATMNANPSGEQLIRAEATKMRRHLPLRKVFAQAADVLTAVCPCWMASPLSVSQLLDSGHQYFDFVIFDEASQVLPEDAIPSILRGNKLVVAGDSKQLPPTTFFAAADDDYDSEEESVATEGYESLLDAMNSFLNGSYLDWHYRSRDESLINFSNHYIYQDRLVTFPGPGGPPAISHVLVEQEFGVDGQEDSCSSEVQRVVALALEHARSYPEQTLGVITMGIKHMNRVQAGLDQALEKQSALGAFFDTGKRERFFVKNLERVQGDERDAIIISIGYGKDRAGNLPLRFGPLLPEGGRRRLNVAVTRARQRLTVVSYFSHVDLDLARVRPGTGVELLRNYLQYASTNGKRLGDSEVTGEPLNAFEAEVFDSLSSKGIRLIPQLGASRFRIDMVAEHPKKPGRYVLAIECDGASYHCSYTARDRDRLRQQQLEGLGWRFHRIWSTDWFMRKEDEIQRALKAFGESVQFADKLDGGVVQPNHGNGDHHSTAATTLQRGPRPSIPVRTSISEYGSVELIQLVKWITSDGQLRTDDQIIDEIVPILGFSRRGVRIEDAVRNAIAQLRTRS
jgi:very-short-patch-repair endonuclease